jgi:3-oxoacyl-[acyl-carrier-protein] synthase II
MRRVVVTGMGLVTPLGADVETVWANLIAGKSGAGRITRFDASDQKCLIACEVKPADHPYGFDPGKRVDHKVQRQVDPFIIYGIDAAGQAIEDAGLTEMTEAQRFRAGCSIGSGIGGLPGIESESLVLAEKGPSRVSPHFVHGRLINLISGQVSIKYGLMGPNHAVVTACSTGAHSIGDAARMIKDDDADIMLAGGAEALSARSALPVLLRRGRCPQPSMTSPRKLAVPMTKTATALSWAKARAWWCLKNMNTPRRAALKFMPK